MHRCLAVLVLACVSSVARADDEAIVKRLKEAGAVVLSKGPDAGLEVQLDADNLDSALTELCELRSLRQLNLRQTGLTDNHVQQVCALPGVKTLAFLDCPITDARLKIVARARGLRTLWLSGTAFTDAGLAELNGLRDLEVLMLRSASVTDAGLRHLEGMPWLACVDLQGCPKLTGAGIARLQKALPKCEIISLLGSPLR
jgi:hypothetical protein